MLKMLLAQIRRLNPFRIDPEEAAQRRNDALRCVCENAGQDWINRTRAVADAFIASLPVGTRFTGETVTLACRNAGVGEPHHHNSWGGVMQGVIKRALRDKLIRRCGSSMTDGVRGHRRRYPAYEVIQ